MNDISLANAIYNGDSNAFKIFFKRYHKPLLAYITTFTNDSKDAEDIVQQAFITLWEERKKLKKNVSSKSYLYKIAYNNYISQYRKKKKHNTFINEFKVLALQECLTEKDDDFRTKKLMSLVNSLPPRCQEILKLSKQENLKYKEIAEHLQISLKTVDAQLQIAYKKIREGFKN
ncbi:MULTISPECIES: RNA polymerase sigma factor [Cellulophaga]|uniref:RNA polymerase, sigma-24 subunit, ECF subfamily n=2 Tax=Cellulophaga TaxID=104264 RepID=F0RG80_CELLC|nr:MULTISPECIES: RNA polymerase sigma-70 factor [Cellulophaga]ADY29046.1 RNA polymerase, sigma-24 subunit, ECF subfamily [Cellulophaga lytica DSM 7489]AIM60088.1 hypothetical protein IX49_05975 [Cellulophaga lytica]EWH13182.1 ECF subfamily RNA polymerase sigma-24 subunit [Cellulophaga geojensis KL-A]TVZ08388.1 RNA polymerase sigma-70 factor (ECF subfamily) [Cellulophaga sp. RHA_52]WQG76782.1 RNA polymerase sigma-70 factor [Cellulophaga lytica]